MQPKQIQPFLIFSLFIFFILTAYAQRKAQEKGIEPTVAPEVYSGLSFREIGPFRGGRSAAVTGVPGQPNLFYFGGTGGGVWRTTDGGRTWENISDGYFGGSVGAVAVAPDDSNVIYVGGGEVTVRGNVSSGYGIWKTEDAGKSWSFGGLPLSRHIPRLVVHPKDYNTVFAAVLGDIYKPTQDRGIYKSVDGGKNWKRTLFSNEDSGAVDLCMDPNNPRILYASTWNVRRTPFSLSSGGAGSALWKSTDSGETWTKISENDGFPVGLLGIIGVTVSPVNSNRLWAIVEHQEKGGVYRSEDAGKTWKQVNSDRSLRQRAWYYSRIYADTKNEDIVYVVNVSYHKSMDGGKTFSSFDAAHGDHHDLWIAPEDPHRMIIGDDGGAQITYEGGETWSTYHNQPTAQFYRLETDNHFPYRIYAAQQDNSTIRIDHRSNETYIDENNWEETAGGESAHIAVDPSNDDIVYGGSYGGFLTRVNHQTGTVRAINVWPDNPMGYGAEGMKYRFQWNFPILFSKHSPKKLYTFSNHVHLSENEGASWKVISPDLTRNDSTKLGPSGGPITKDNTGVEYYCTLFAAAESPLKEGLIWVGSDDGLIHLTRNGGENWQNVTPKELPEWIMINSIEPSPFDEGTCYIAGTLYKTGDYLPYLYKTSNYGATWTKITNGIKKEHFTRVLRADPKSKGILYAGTESGLYVSFDDGSKWQQFQLNLPIVPITDLAVKENNLIVATQGRSLWILDDLTLISQLNSSIKDKQVHLFAPKDSYRMKGGYNPEGSKTMGTNHPNGVITYFYLNKWDKEKDTLYLTYFDHRGDTIRSFSSAEKKDKIVTKEGLNSFIWDLRYKGADKLEDMILWWTSLNGPKAVPGTYSIRISYRGYTEERKFKILPDPRAEVSIAEMQEQFDFIQEINSSINRAHSAIKNIRSLRKNLDDFVMAYDNNPQTKSLVLKAKSINERLSEVEKALYQTNNKSNQDPLNFPIKLTNKLGHLASLVSIDDFPPTMQDKQVKQELSQQIEQQLRAYHEILEKYVDDFNSEFNSLHLDYLNVTDK